MKQKKTVFSILLQTAAHARLLCLALIGVVAGAIIVSLLPPLVLEYGVNRLADGQGISFGTALGYVLLLILSGILSSARESLLVVFGQRITCALRRELCFKLSRLPADTLVHQEAGAAVSRFVGDVDTVENLFTSGIISMFADACQLCGILIVVFSRNLGLALLLLCMLPLLFAFTRIVQKKMLHWQLANRAAVAKVSNHVPETIRCIRTLHILRKEHWAQDRYLADLNDSFAAQEKNNFYDAVYSPVILILSAVTVGIAMLLSASGNPAVTKLFGMSAGTSVAMISYISQVFTPLESIGMEIQTIQSAMAGVKRIDLFLAQEERWPTDLMPSDGKPCVELSGVSFHYNDDAEVLRDLSFRVERGESVTLTGRTGAGKSTVFKLLLGLYRPQKGTVKINGADAARLPDSARRALFGCVEQTFKRVPGTVRDQITLFDPEITQDKVEEAARIADLADTIAALPQGYDTPCTPEMFSQGQWQLLSIARAVAAQPQILLLDEITANLDAETELTILSALRRAGKHRTVLSISHRLYEQMGGREISI